MSNITNKAVYLLIGLLALALLSASSAYYFIGLSSLSFAQTPTKTPTKPVTPSPTPIDNKITELKERIATQVAKLNIIQKRGIGGTISDSPNNQLILIDLEGNKRFIDVDELTKFTDLAGKQIGISDLKKEDNIAVIGLYNSESRRLLARFIRVRQFPTRVKGEVMDVDSKNFQIEVADLDKNDTKLVDIEKTTSTQEWTHQDGLTKSGFSKIAVGEKILVVGSTKGRDKLIASRILLLPELSPNLKPTPTSTQTPTPTKKPSPTPTPTKTP